MSTHHTLCLAVLASALALTANASSHSEMESGTDYPRQALFGDTHVHTGWSADAGMDGAITSPEDAYRFALGQEVESNSGLKAKLSRPFDWFMVTDHSDGMGTINEIVAGNPEMMENDILKRFKAAIEEGGEAAASAKSELIRMQSNGELPEEIMDPKWMKSAWEKTIEAAEKYNEPGQFSTFIAYEWTVNSDGGDNLHRNVIFRDGADKAGQVLPLTTFVTQDSYKLWQWMAEYEKKTGGQVLAIPHNGNMSNGRMFELQQFDGSAMTKEWAEMRAKYEPLYELTQIKGQSESHPSLSPNDEFADWDLWDRGNLILKPKPEGAIQYEYWREALKNGLRIKEELGVNPFQQGANAATDTHTGLSTPDEDNFYGKFKTVEPRAERWDFPLLEGIDSNYMGWEQAASGVMGVWATENTREAIWDAMARKETFATSGPRMEVRFFGGFDYSEEDLTGDLVAAGYDKGVPMGANLSANGNNKAPTFLIAAKKDPESGNLDRAQVIKGWVDDSGETHEKVFDVVWSGERKIGDDGKLPAVGNTVNMETAEYSNSIGAAELMGYFTDPSFDPDQPAFYYVRVLEIPTPRWTLYDKVRFDVSMPDEVPLVHQERAFSSPIWYTPED
ncbi:DUF3604 domain-containing protein [Marinobacter salinisoli]|uniref:DUF3604 domain-containing protein n=1 Tax=Marinobacter salinisoli TaxID=2769486 RepID=A0ABX7MM93_9GAMM|nr:DUF3604 domain-containing protein [Marinobacter salinisoli]QSP93301.1 DUF3604 domain-containing protein [Marinobacter salinisoli]